MAAILADDIFKWIFLNENVIISIEKSLKSVPKGPINNIPALVQIMAWRRPGDKPLSGPMMVRLPTHICVTRPEWVKYGFYTLMDDSLCSHVACNTIDEIYSQFWGYRILSCDLLTCIRQGHFTKVESIWGLSKYNDVILPL